MTQACLHTAGQPARVPVRAPLRARLGCWAHERWRAECALRPGLAWASGIDWTDLCNRHERLERVERGRRCPWPDSSCLTVARVFPEVGARLLARCLEEWPIGWSGGAGLSPTPEVSVVLPVGGADRVAQMTAVVRCFLGQSFSGAELIVSEYGVASALEGLLPPGVRHVFTASSGAAFNKSRAMNRGVEAARGPVVVLHDADVLVPRDYLSQVAGALAAGWDAVRPVRFLFMADAAASEAVVAGRLPAALAEIQQNTAGLSTAVRRTTYLALGGHDERFEGWGGEDTEFLDRLRTRRLHPGAWLPAVHLWHAAAPGKRAGARNADQMKRILAVPVEERIRALTRAGDATR